MRCSSPIATTPSWCAAVREAPARVAWFTLGEPVRGTAGWRGDVLVADDGTELFTVTGHRAPHDRANIAAAALAARAVARDRTRWARQSAIS